jgi:hypothetical protein
MAQAMPLPAARDEVVIGFLARVYMVMALGLVVTARGANGTTGNLQLERLAERLTRVVVGARCIASWCPGHAARAR